MHVQVKAVMLGHLKGGDGKRHSLPEFSLRASAIAAAEKGDRPQACIGSLSDLKPGQQVLGFVQEVALEYLWVAISPMIRGRLHQLDSAESPQELHNFATRFSPGQPLRCRVLHLDTAKGGLDFTLREPAAGVVKGKKGKAATGGSAAAPQPGALLLGKITRVEGSGLAVQLAGKMTGKVAISDIHDVYVDNALHGIKEGTFVKCHVLVSCRNFEGLHAPTS